MTLPKTTHNTSTLNTGETWSNYSVKLSHFPHNSSHGTFLDSLIPDVNQRLKRRHTAPAFHTIFYGVFGLVRNQHEFPSCRIDFNPRTYFVRPKTCYCQQQSSQYPIFPSQARDQSFTRVAKWDEIRADIGRSRLCQSGDLFLVKGLMMPFGKVRSRQPKKL